MTDSVKRLMAVEVDDSAWVEYEAPRMWDGLSDTDGEAVFRRVVDIPARLAGKDLVLHLGSVDDFDDTYFNGEHVGSTDVRTPDFWSHPRVYQIPGRLVKEGRNILAVRCFDHFGGGGFGAQPHDMLMIVENEEQYLPPSLYHADYRTDFERGDDPYRYYRW
jgi:sialate O-acetylesterase